MAALFGNSSDGRREPRSLVEFRAGKMTLSGSTVTADTRKGLIYMKQEDRLMHFYWKDRNSSEVVDDLILFPGEVEFKRVTQCSTGRVFLLKFRDRLDRKYFYWMQEPKESRDEELQKKVNDLINNPPDPTQSAADGLGGSLQSLMGGQGASLQSLLAGNSNPQLLEQLLSSGALALPPGMFEGIRGSSSSSSTTSGGTESGRRRGGTSQHTPTSRPQQQQPQPPPQPQPQSQLQLDDLQNILSSMNIPPAQATPATEEEDKVNLTDVVTSDVLRPLSSDPAVRNEVESHLPPTSESLALVLTSPQFQQALVTFNSALQSGQLGPLMGQFGLGGGVVSAANTGDVDGFVAALQNDLSEQGTSGTSGQDDGGGGGERTDVEKEKGKDGSSEGAGEEEGTAEGEAAPSNQDKSVGAEVPAAPSDQGNKNGGSAEEEKVAPGAPSEEQH